MLEILEASPQRSHKVKDLARALGIARDRYRDFRSFVHEQAREGRIASLPRRRFQALSGAQLLQGRVEGVGLRATAVVDADGRSHRLLERSLVDVVPGDVVRFRPGRDDDGHGAMVQAILSATSRRILGELQRYGSRWALLPLARIPGLSGGVFLDEAMQPDDALQGQLAWGELPAFQPSTERPTLSSYELVGAQDHPRGAMAIRIAYANWPGPFSEAAEREASQPLEDERERRDFREQLVFTIDPATAKDHDDAVSIERLDGGGFRLGVHIADVASHVPSDGRIDAEALERCTSVYPPGDVLPMLPEALSAGECSLHDGVDRRCMSVLLEYDAEGKRCSMGVGRSQIRSRASLSYEQAQEFIGARDGGDVGEAVRSMYQLASRLRERRHTAGSLFFERPEREFGFDDEGHVSTVTLRGSLESHWLIEEFMLEANRAVAETLHAARLPLLWRVHDDPDERKVDDLCEILEALGLRFVPKDPIEAHDYMELLARIEGRADAGVLNLLVLRSLMKAEYRVGWEGHFGLGFDEYTHFTSPIRRYPDLHNQRWLHRLIDAVGENGWIVDPREILQGRRLRLSDAADRQVSEELALRCSEQERAASLIERDCADICAADYLKPRVGDLFDGTVVTLTSRGFFVELDEAGIDGFVGLDQLPSDWYSLEPSRHAFVGERTGRRIRLGQRVRVALDQVDVTSGRLWLGFEGDLPTRKGTASRRGHQEDRSG